MNGLNIWHDFKGIVQICCRQFLALHQQVSALSDPQITSALPNLTWTTFGADGPPQTDLNSFSVHWNINIKETCVDQIDLNHLAKIQVFLLPPPAFPNPLQLPLGSWCIIMWTTP